LEFDITTASRFHPLEMLLSMLIKAAIIFAIGTPWLAVLIFEVILNAAAVFNHANVRLPPSAERWLRRIVVTPDMHLIHHSVLAEEHNSNFGFNLSCWDRLFGTYCPEWRGGPSAPIVIGLAQQRQCANFMTLLAMPFQRDALRGRTIASPRDIKSDRAAASPDSLR
jgi:sterol desaturase/sphingolipid hydroxylase (fatty acid hydroxylase superfamily)